MSGFTDIHAHFVYGMDDGAQNRTDMKAMLDAAHADGIAFLCFISKMLWNSLFGYRGKEITDRCIAAVATRCKRCYREGYRSYDR